jgi:hypothetical protein
MQEEKHEKIIGCLICRSIRRLMAVAAVDIMWIKIPNFA